VSIQFVQRDSGGDVTYQAPARWDATPVPVVVLYSPTNGELVASQNATLGPATTLDAAAAAGQTTIPLTATTGVTVGGQYIVTNATSESEWVTVAAITSGVSVTVRDDLEHTYASADAFESTALSVTMTAGEADTAYRHCYARWTYEVGGQSQIDTSLFNVSIWTPRLTLTTQDILRREPRAVDMLGTRQDLEDLIEDIWGNEILGDLGQSCDPGALLSAESLRIAVHYRVLAEIYLHAQDHEHSDRLFDMYRGAWERVLQQTPIDVDQSGTVDDDDIVRPAWTGRLFRV